LKGVTEYDAYVAHIQALNSTSLILAHGHKLK